MARNVFFRDFTLCKAAMLAGLIGLATLMGEVPEVAPALAGTEAAPARILPAAAPVLRAECDEAAWSGVSL